MSSNLYGVDRGAKFLVILLGVATFLFLSVAGDASGQTPPLTIQGRNLYLGNRPAYLFGQGFWHAAVKGGFDYDAEADWYVPYRANLTRIKTVTTRIVTSSNYTPENPWILLSTGKYDLNTFNETFWKRLDQVIRKNEATGRMVVLQIFDEVTMKKGTDAWDRHPLNPANNINNLVNMPGKGQDGRPEVWDVTNTKLMDYYQRYIGRLLESTYKYGNVIFEVCNEYSGTTVFLEKVLGWIQTFEKSKNVNLLVTNMSCTKMLWDHENASSCIDLLDFWHAPRSIRTFKVEEIYNYVTSLRASTTKPVFTGRIGPEPDITQDTANYRRVARSQLWAILMAGGVAASTKEDNNGKIENGPPVYNIDDKWEAQGFLGMHTVLDNLWHTGVLTPKQDLILSKPFTQNWAATVGHEALVYLLAPGGGTLALKNLPNGIYTVKVFAPDPCQVQRVERIRVTQGQLSIPIQAINEGDCVIWLTPEPFDVTSRWEEQNGLYRSVIEVRDIALFTHTILLNGMDVSRDILHLYKVHPLKNGVQIMTPWIKFPAGIYELEVWIHGPEMSDRSIMRMRVP